ncbi:hypothetical protein ABT040_16185 [Streptomyces sp. NPDC002688]|uniref:hypothetical protein n=1 Tax=Streptomyces sp. NPDC002688 TaxID=3154423 RepID=UPI0033274E0D
MIHVLSQRIVWTVLPPAPAPASRRALRLSVHIAPRLRSDDPADTPHLDAYPDLLDWPATVRHKVSFELLADGAPLPATLVSRPDSATWSALFTAATRVRPETFSDLPSRRIRSYPAAEVTSFLLDRYRQVAVDWPTTYPPDSELTGLFGPVGYDPDTGLKDAADEVERLLNDHQAIPPGLTGPGENLYQVRRFLQPRGAALVELPPPSYDFHDLVASLADHPTLLRRTGLVLDLEVSRAAVADLSPEPELLLRPVWTPELTDSQDVLPGTRCVVTDGYGLAARPREELHRDGLLAVGGDDFTVLQVDQDGAAVKSLDLLVNLQNAAEHRTPSTPDRHALPSLRSAGFALAAQGRAASLVTSMRRAEQLYRDADTGAPLSLDAEDLVRGYRVDVLDELAGRWYPLHARTGEAVLTATGTKVRIAQEESVLLPAPTSAADDSSPDLYLQETLFQWHGWSLALPRPGAVLDPDDRIQDQPGGTPGDLLATHYTVPRGSLPALRFGRAYRFRMRAADLAGTSTPFQARPATTPAGTVTDPVTLHRWEPVGHPLLAARTPLPDDEDDTRLVIRSDFDRPAVATAERHIVPPAASQLLAEYHGCFDLPSGRLDPAAWDQITAREGLRLADHPSAEPDPGRPGSHYYDTDRLTVPYLPDPLCRGVVLDGLPGRATPLKVPFTPDPGAPWCDLRPVRLVLTEGPAPASSYDPARHVIRVELPKTAVATVRMSAYVDPPDLTGLGIWSLIEIHPGANLEQLQAVVTGGRHWMITPYQEITLTHAVRRPLIAPAFRRFGVTREADRTDARCEDMLLLDRAGTGQIDVTATWTDPVDGGPGSPAPATTDIRATAFTTQVDDTIPGDTLILDGAHQFGDTRHHEVTYRATATSRFTPHFGERLVAPLAAGTPRLLAAAGLVPGSVRITAPDGSGEYAEGRDFTVDADAGTVVRTDPSGIAEGAPVRITWLARPVTRDCPVPAVCHVPASTRPPAPRPHPALPAFAWSREQDGTWTVSRRTGNTLRVLLDRPWYVSGAGELLAVLLEAGSGSTPRPLADRTLSRLGEDPVHASPGKLPPSLTAAMFSGATEVCGLSLPGETAQVDIAAFPVRFDAERDRWYADLTLAPGAVVAPQLRLGLARYQPHALPERELSAPVVLDFAPLLPDRTVRVQRTAEDRCTVEVTGPTQLGTRELPHPTRMLVTAEVHDPAVPGPLGWRTPTPGTAPVELAAGPNGTGPTTWTGTVPLPAAEGFTPDGRRLTVEEFQPLATLADDDTATTRDRLLYLDTVELPS